MLASVVQSIRQELRLEPTGRPAKSTSSIIEKLRRESIRLTQVQDVAGCRIVVADVVAQNRVVSSLQPLFARTTVIDRRTKPSHGYRAVHVIVYIGPTLIEIQIRSALQHMWAEVSEKLADTIEPAIKYGGGPPTIMDLLTKASDTVASLEAAEMQAAHRAAETGVPQSAQPEQVRSVLDDIRSDIRSLFTSLIASADELKGKLR